MNAHVDFAEINRAARESVRDFVPAPGASALNDQFLFALREMKAAATPSDPWRDIYIGNVFDCNKASDIEALPIKKHFLFVTPYPLIGAYRPDFGIALLRPKQPWFWVAVELDGHEHHNLSADKATRDRQRDRELQAAGVPVIRFSGSEVWRNPAGVVDEAIECACEIFLRRIDEKPRQSIA